MLSTRALKVLSYAIKFNRSDIIDNMKDVNDVCMYDFLIAGKIVLDEEDIAEIAKILEGW